MGDAKEARWHKQCNAIEVKNKESTINVVWKNNIGSYPWKPWESQGDSVSLSKYNKIQIHC